VKVARPDEYDRLSSGGHGVLPGITSGAWQPEAVAPGVTGIQDGGPGRVGRCRTGPVTAFYGRFRPCSGSTMFFRFFCGRRTGRGARGEDVDRRRRARQPCAGGRVDSFTGRARSGRLLQRRRAGCSFGDRPGSGTTLLGPIRFVTRPVLRNVVPDPLAPAAFTPPAPIRVFHTATPPPAGRAPGVLKRITLLFIELWRITQLLNGARAGVSTGVAGSRRRPPAAGARRPRRW